MPVIEITEFVFTKVADTLPIGTKISPTQMVRAALLLVKQSRLTEEQIYSLIGQTSTEDALIHSLEALS